MFVHCRSQATVNVSILVIYAVQHVSSLLSVCCRSAEERFRALEVPSSSLEVKVELRKVGNLLGKYDVIFGSPSPDLQALSKQLTQKQNEIDSLRLQLKQQEQVSAISRDMV